METIHPGDCIVCLKNTLGYSYRDNYIYKCAQITDKYIFTELDSENIQNNAWLSDYFRKATPLEEFLYFCNGVCASTMLDMVLVENNIRMEIYGKA